MSHPTDVDTYIRFVYIAASAFWIILIVILALYQTDVIGWGIIALPIILFWLAFINAEYISVEDEIRSTSEGFLSIGLLLVVPIIVWMSEGYGGDKETFVQTLVVAVILTMLAMLNIWTSPVWAPAKIHLRSAFETMALTLLVYSLYSYYIDKGPKCSHPEP